jgi:hypothetical protein
MTQICDKHIEAPTILPDFDNTKDNKLFDVVTGEDIYSRKVSYKAHLNRSKTVGNKGRSYVNGALYKNLPNNVFCVDPREEGDLDIKVRCLDENNKFQQHSWLLVRLVNTTSDLMKILRQLSKTTIGKSGNARSHTRDKGKMFALGLRVQPHTIGDYKKMKNSFLIQLYVLNWH